MREYLKSRILAGGIALALLLGVCPRALAMERAFGYSRILASGAPAPGATITVFNAGTVTLSTIFSDNLSTPKANPFTADSFGYWFLYAANGRYDIRLSGGGIVTPYTLSDVLILDSTAPLSLCGVSGSAIALATSTTGTDFTLTCNDTTDTITYNLPSASAANRGLVTTGAQTIAGAKTFSTPIAIGSGGTGLNIAAPANGKILIGNGTGFTLNNISVGAGLSIVNGAGAIALSFNPSLPTTNVTFESVTTTSAVSPLILQGYLGSLTSGGPLVVDPVSTIVTPVELTNGELLIGSTGTSPIVSTIGAGPGISISSGAGSITVGNAYSLNGIAASSFPTQTFAVSSSGSDFGISSSGGIHTFSLPNAGLIVRGVVSTAAQSFAGAKTFNAALYPLVQVGGVTTSGTDAASTSNWLIVPSIGTGTGATGTITVQAGHKQVSGTTAHTVSNFEQWQGGTVADPVTDEITVSSTHGGKWVRGVMEELLTLSTGAATTNTASNLLPADSIIEAVTTRVTTTISGGGVTAFSVGDTTTAARFSASAGGLTSSSTRVGIAHWSGAVTTLAAGPSQAAAATVRITCDATPTAGVVRITVFYRRFVAPTS